MNARAAPGGPGSLTTVLSRSSLHPGDALVGMAPPQTSSHSHHPTCSRGRRNHEGRGPLLVPPGANLPAVTLRRWQSGGQGSRAREATQGFSRTRKRLQGSSEPAPHAFPTVGARLGMGRHLVHLDGAGNGERHPREVKCWTRRA